MLEGPGNVQIHACIRQLEYCLYNVGPKELD
jgi:hypothetical protein